MMSTSDGHDRDVELEAIHKEIGEIVCPLQTLFHRGSTVSVLGKTWKGHLVVWSYCCDIVEGEDISSSLRNQKGHPCIRFLV